MAPVIQLLKADGAFRCRVVATAQHRHLLDQVLRVFQLEPDIDLDVMLPNQTLTELTARLLTRLGGLLDEEKPHAVLAQGDTTTVMATALACFYRGIPFGHVEAGLRTGDMQNPFPEEMNRVVTSHMTRWHFAPTARAAERLQQEGYAPASIHMTGNTVIDALHQVAATHPSPGLTLDPARRLLLVTLHRRENHGEPLRRICAALRTLVERNTDVELLLPVHPNPNVAATIRDTLGTHPRVLLSEPLDYTCFVGAMQRAYLVLSDSGGVQEEAPALGKPVLVLRETTERPEAIEAGVCRLVGTETAAIERAAQQLLDDPQAYRAMATHVSPYGDGQAARRIVNALRRDLVG